jgi:hypothetical protein
VKGDNKRSDTDLSDISHWTIDKQIRRETRMGGKKFINGRTLEKFVALMAIAVKIFKSFSDSG